MAVDLWSHMHIYCFQSNCSKTFLLRGMDKRLFQILWRLVHKWCQSCPPTLDAVKMILYAVHGQTLVRILQEFWVPTCVSIQYCSGCSYCVCLFLGAEWAGVGACSQTGKHCRDETAHWFRCISECCWWVWHHCTDAAGCTGSGWRSPAAVGPPGLSRQ